MTNTPTFSTAALRQFTGTERWYRHALVPRIVFTDGAKFVADSAGAYWLLDDIACAQLAEEAVAKVRFQLWKLVVAADASADLTCEDGNGGIVYRKHLDWTDFPAEGVTLYFTDNTILVPMEY